MIHESSVAHYRFIGGNDAANSPSDADSTRVQTSSEMPCIDCGIQMLLALKESRDLQYDVLRVDQKDSDFTPKHPDDRGKANGFRLPGPEPTDDEGCERTIGLVMPR